MKAAVFFLLASLCCGLAAECGKRRKENSTLLITGGRDALPHEFPWQVALQFGSVWFCGGSIVNEDWIVTAAHCAKYPTALYSIYAGKHDMKKTEKGQEKRSVTQILIHPLFWEGKKTYDVALMKLSRPLNLDVTPHIGPVCLPKDAQEFTGQTCTASGWGLTSPDGHEAAHILQKLDLSVLSSKQCEEALGIPWVVPDSMVCAGHDRGGKGPCRGDSGGPLVCQRQDGNWVLAGIVSSTVGNCSGYGSPGIFTFVPHVLEWMETEMRHH